MSISWLKEIILKYTLVRDIAYTMTSFTVLAVSGILINIIITLTRDSEALGIFNLSYTVYVILAQVATVGVQYSILTNSARYNDDKTALGKILGTGALMCLFFGILVASFLCWLCYELKDFFRHESVYLAIIYSTFGLTIFPLNKVLQSYLNGIRHIKFFSIIQSLRYITVMLIVSTVSISSLPIEYSALSFLVAELITAVLAWWYIYNKTSVGTLKFDTTWMKKHWGFGIYAFWFTILADVNSKIDILLIAIFLNEKLVGIYSFLAMLVDGIYHALAMVRINFNPVLVSIISKNKLGSAQQMLTKSKQYIFPITLVLATIIFACFYIFAVYIAPEKDLQYGILPLSILLTGITAISFLMPFDNLMVVSGHPGYQTIQQLAVILSNIAVTTTLIADLGITGAAIGTITGYLIGIIVLITLTKHFITWNLISNSYYGRN